MKKTMFLLMIVSIAALSSCNKKNDTSPNSSNGTAANLPLKASQYIDTNYPDASIIYVVAMKNSTAAYIATLNTTEELAFTALGDFLGDGTLYHTGTPGEGDTIHCDSIGCGGGHHGGGHHGGGHHGGGNHGGGHNENVIPVDSLPALIKDYISANYSGYTIRHAEYDSICPEGLVTEVVISVVGLEPVKLYFDAFSNFLMQDNRILFADVSVAAKDYITANYPGYLPCNRATKLIMADNNLQFIIYIHLGQIKKNVRLNDDGTFVCKK